MFCTACGQPLAENARFCTSCGQKITTEQAEMKEQLDASQSFHEAEASTYEAGAATEPVSAMSREAFPAFKTPEPVEDKPEITVETAQHFSTTAGTAPAETATMGTAATAHAASLPSTEVSETAIVKAPDAPNPVVAALKDYGQFLLTHLKQPTKRSRRVTAATDKTNGLIHLGVFVFLFSLAYYLMSTQNPFLEALFSVNSGFSFTENRNEFVEFFLKPLIGMAIMIAAGAGLAYMASRLMKTNLDIWEVTVRYASYLVVPAAMFTLLALASLVSVELSFYVLLLALLSLALALALCIFSFHNEKNEKYDPLYVSLGAFVVLFVLYFGILT
ncbi:zinc-ribbon domain-containing protein [Marinicrinis sediminis]|uniref:Zinc-ribbon domain-containing protein n=1 Tax=Marinicrinis sediminis TaxID=1652465 RepID=A0ABW5RFG3_9BACL